MSQTTPDPFQGLSHIVRQRETIKLIADPQRPVELDANCRSTFDPLVEQAIHTAGWAPFHYDRDHESMPEPWRVDWVQYEDCREIGRHFFDWFPDAKPKNKLPAMLAACGSLVLVRWLPQFDEQSEAGTLTDAQRQVDEEHLAAASAYVQNLLLLLTAGGLGTYWSSGGQFRLPAMRSRLGIPTEGRLLAAIFVDYQADSERVIDRIPGKHRQARTRHWYQIRQLDAGRQA